MDYFDAEGSGQAAPLCIYGENMKSIIKKIISKNILLAKTATYLKYLKQSINKEKEEPILNAINEFAPNIQNKNKIYRDILCEKTFFNMVNYNEYFMFQFTKCSQKQRREYIQTNEYAEIWDSLGIDVDNNLLKNKYELYEALKPYYKRDIIEVCSMEDYYQFVEFVKKHSKFLLKPIEGSLGSGIKLIEIKDPNQYKQYFFSILQVGGVVLEEIIVQEDELSVFHNESVNTVRVACFITQSKVIPFYAMFRMGRGESVVDNASSGGIACAVDLKTGKLLSDGYTKKCEHFYKHPDSDIEIKGYQLPEWNELLNIVEELSLNLKEYKLIGWDMAYTKDGWVVVEGNNRPNINTIQMCLGHGLRNVIEKTIATL